MPVCLSGVTVTKLTRDSSLPASVYLELWHTASPKPSPPRFSTLRQSWPRCLLCYKRISTQIHPCLRQLSIYDSPSTKDFSQLHGKFEANCSLPSSNSTGIWPAFWLMPQGGACWPTGGEIDIFEFNGNPLEDRIYGSYHWAPPGAENCGKDHAPIPGRGYRPKGAPRGWQQGWHVYGIEWNATSIVFTVDGESYFTVSHPDLPTDPMYIILNQAVDPWLFRPTPFDPGSYPPSGVFLRVDWVRVWTLQ